MLHNSRGSVLKRQNASFDLHVGPRSQRPPTLLDMFAVLLTSRGSVFPRALCFSLPCAIIAVVLKVFELESMLGLGVYFGRDPLTDSAAYSGFSLVLGFLFVFRTNMAYNRYWEGSTAGRRMFAEWFDAASTILAFTQSSKASPEVTATFVNQFIEYLSLLHGAAVATLRGDDLLSIITLEGLEESSVLELQESVFPMSLIFHWVQQLLVQHLDTGVLACPPPIVSRAFQEFANGMIAFHDAERVQTTPFPFPYVQMTTLLLLVHWCITPIAMCMWSNKVEWVFIFTMVQVFIFWCLYFTAFEIEHPFKRGHNTYAAESAHDDFNLELQQLMMAKPAALHSSGTKNSVRFHMLHGTEASPSLAGTFSAMPGLTKSERRRSRMATAQKRKTKMMSASTRVTRGDNSDSTVRFRPSLVSFTSDQTARTADLERSASSIGKVDFEHLASNIGKVDLEHLASDLAACRQEESGSFQQERSLPSSEQCTGLVVWVAELADKLQACPNGCARAADTQLRSYSGPTAPRDGPTAPSSAARCGVEPSAALATPRCEGFVVQICDERQSAEEPANDAASVTSGRVLMSADL